jgi:heptosyltransferase-3
MTSVLDRIPSGARAAVIRLRSLGDCVLTTPALALLREARPDLRIGVVVEPWLAPIFTDHPAVSEILPPASLRAFRPHLCLNLHGGTRSAWLTALSGARLRAGFEHFRFQALYNVHIPRAQAILGVNRTVHTAEHLASAVFFLGVPSSPIGRADIRVRAGRPRPESREYAVIHPFASSPEKTWPASRFLALAGALSSQFDVVFIGANNDNLSPFHEFKIVQGSDLENLKSLLAGASLFIGNDSGPAHMAAALGVPVIVLWGNSSQEIWGPWQAEHVLLPDLAHVSVETALDAVERLRVRA